MSSTYMSGMWVPSQKVKCLGSWSIEEAFYWVDIDMEEITSKSVELIKVGEPTHIWLVAWNIFYFSIYWVSNHSNWLIHIFQRGGSATNQISMWIQMIALSVGAQHASMRVCQKFESLAAVKRQNKSSRWPCNHGFTNKNMILYLTSNNNWHVYVRRVAWKQCWGLFQWQFFGTARNSHKWRCMLLPCAMTYL